MQALGLIETEGLIAAIVSVDAMLKAANVNLLDRTYVGGGLVSVAVVGDVGAVKAAIEAGAASVKAIGDLLISQHVIPRPHKELEDNIVPSVPLKDRDIEREILVEVEKENIQIEDEIAEDTKVEDIGDEEAPPEEENVDSIKPESKKQEPKKPHGKRDIDDMVNEYGLETSIESLNKLKVTELRNLARKYEDFGIKGREISKAGKKLLITEFKKYYGEN